MMKMMMQMMGKMGKDKGNSSWGKKKGGGISLSNFAADKKVWVGDIPDGVTSRELHEHFKEAGAKWSESYGGASKGTGGVAFKTAEETQNAISSLNGSILKGAAIQ